MCFFFSKLLEVLENNKGKVNRIHPLSGVWNHINVFVNTVFADQQGRKQPSFFLNLFRGSDTLPFSMCWPIKLLSASELITSIKK